MPAPIVPTLPPATVSAPGTAPSTAGDGAVPFDALLAAAFAGTATAEPDPVAVVSAERDGLRSEDAAVNNTQIAELLPPAVELAAAPAVPLQAALQTDVASAVATPLAIDALMPARLPLPAPESVAPKTSLRTETAATLAMADPAPPLPDPARIAVPSADATFQPPGSPAAARPATIEPATIELSATRDPLLTQRPDPEAPVNLVPMASERAENAARPPAHPVRLDIAAPVASREFGAEVGNRLVWMATHNHQVAELRIEPPQLGPVEVRLSLANDQASLSIASPHAAVRDAIQASLPRLQDMLQGLGITLANVSVGAEGFAQGSADHSGLAQGWGQSAEHALPNHAYPLPGAVAAATPPFHAGTGVIDVYA